MLPLIFLLLPFTLAALPLCPDRSNATVDYVVVGAGAGGGPLAARLSDAGFSVLLIDSGHSVVDFDIIIPGYLGVGYSDPNVELNYTVSDYPDGFKYQKDDWYPRARAIGGCTVHNGLINNIAGTQTTFDAIAETFNDPSWSRANMQNYYKLLERNLYLDQPNEEHGFDGWLRNTVAANQSISEGTPPPPDFQGTEINTALQNSAPAVSDFNVLAGTKAVGYNLMPWTVNENNTRSSIHERLVEVADKEPQHLRIAIDTLVTKALTCRTKEGSIRAYGVEMAAGAALPVAINFTGKQTLETKQVLVKHEVIVSAGTFQSPQLLMLSGIGDSAELSKFGIETIVNLPGVGKNLQDNDELPGVWELLPKNSTDGLVCNNFSQDPTTNQCLAEWIQTGHRTPLSKAGAFGITAKTFPELSEPDMLVYGGNFYFLGFIRDLIPPPINAWSLVSLLGPAKSRGTVTLTGSHPQDPLNIQKLRFQSLEAQRDVVRLRQGLKRMRALMATPEIAKYVAKELFPGPDVVTDEQIDDYVYKFAYGHHGCCTNAMGPANDTMSVLDNEFRVRGVQGLRVVDGSAWPRPIGFYPTTPTYMMAEKAAAVIINDARKTRDN
ncbi:hypothetical protein C8J56DRAFT_1101248 [Mycena floridula]|nr:hypothetical protein C8J56DRAFT_1101248 [Mycena floridula]